MFHTIFYTLQPRVQQRGKEQGGYLTPQAIECTPCTSLTQNILQLMNIANSKTVLLCVIVQLLDSIYNILIQLPHLYLIVNAT
jgi:hypothetical protein